MRKLIKKLAYKYADYQKFKKEIETIKYGNQGKKRLSFSKRVTIALLVWLLVIQIYCMFVMFIFADLTALPTFITTIIGQLITIVSYSAKSCLENRSGGITYELAMKDAEG